MNPPVNPQDWYKLHELVKWPARESAVPTVHQPVVATMPDRIEIHPTARIDSFTKLCGGGGCIIGPHVHIASFCDLNVGGGFLWIANGSTLSSHVIITTGQSVIGKGKSGSASHPDFEKRVSSVVIGRNVTVFAGAIIVARPGRKLVIDEGAVIAAGSLVLDDVKAYTMVGGSPATWMKDIPRG